MLLPFLDVMQCAEKYAGGSWLHMSLDRSFCIRMKSRTISKFESHFQLTHGKQNHQMQEKLVQDLEKLAEASQRAVTNVIASHEVKYPYQSFWVTNEVILENADILLLKKLKKLHCIQSIQVMDPPILNTSSSMKDMASDKGQMERQDEVKWNIKLLGAPEVWSKGYDGKGVLIGVISSGAKGNHDQLQGKYIYNEYGWYDATEENTAFPSEGFYQRGQGTMRLGEALADGGYGVAPGAKYMACKACRGTTCPYQNYLKCVEYVMCPWNKLGEKNCSHTPRAVALGFNTYYSGFDNWDFETTITGMHSAGILVVTEAVSWPHKPPQERCGAITPACAHPKSLCTSYTNQTSRSPFAGCGPYKNETTIKPDVLVPGYDYYVPSICAYNHQTNCYEYNQGYTSGSGHILGVAALLLERNPGLGPDDVKKLILESCRDFDNTHPKSPHNCSGIDDSVLPNYIKGHGFVNALRAWELTPCTEVNSTALNT